ncbi:MAG: hypothetical protein AB2799_14035 [Candidatus Thiodiazotropha sp.]
MSEKKDEDGIKIVTEVNNSKASESEIKETLKAVQSKLLTRLADAQRNKSNDPRTADFSRDTFSRNGFSRDTFSRGYD